MGGVNEADAKEAMRLAGHKLPIKTKFVTKAQLEAEAAGEVKGGEAE
jgi:large subunit ribosomal protein L16